MNATLRKLRTDIEWLSRTQAGLAHYIKRQEMHLVILFIISVLTSVIASSIITVVLVEKFLK